MIYVIQTALELGFMYALVAMALFLSYRILDIADLTTDSGFVLGAAVSVNSSGSRTSVPGYFWQQWLPEACCRFCHCISADMTGSSVDSRRNRNITQDFIR